ncbi:hypothetical protein JCM8202_004567 [Rhodotorula sphaerocarpa]
MATWAESVRSALVARDARDRAFEPFFSDYGRLARHAALLHDRTAAVLDAASKAPSAPASSDRAQPMAAAEKDGARTATSDSAQETAVRAALVTRLESELASARAELADAYKLQSQHSQRLLALSDQLHATDERARADRDQLADVRAEVERLREGARWHKEVVAEKERQLVILQDELGSLELELSQLELQNDNLKTDNAALLQRWIAAKTDEARRMNEANAFLEEAKRIRAECAQGQGAAEAAGTEDSTGGKREPGEASGASSETPADPKGKGKAKAG